MASPRMQPVGHHREREAGGDRHEWDEHEPPGRVADRPEHARVGEDEPVVVEADELVRVRVSEADEDRVEDRVHEEHEQQDERRSHEDVGANRLPEALRQVVDGSVQHPEEQEDAADADDDREGDDAHAVRVRIVEVAERQREDDGRRGDSEDERDDPLRRPPGAFVGRGRLPLVRRGLGTARPYLSGLHDVPSLPASRTGDDAGGAAAAAPPHVRRTPPGRGPASRRSRRRPAVLDVVQHTAQGA